MDIEHFNQYLLKMIPEEPKETFLGIKEYVSRGGKRARPLLLFLTYGTFKGYHEDIYKYGALIELFHNFTLIHDDIEDFSKERRGKPTLHEMYGIPLALNIGDALYTFVYNEILKIEDAFVRRKYGEIFMEVVKGQGYDIYWRENKIFPDKEEDYFKMARRKTAVLIGFSMGLGAYLANQDYETFYKIGEKLGIAFQIQDDILNLEEETPEYGKVWADDITEGKRTLMVIYALSKLPPEKKERLKQLLNSHPEKDEEKREVIDLLNEVGAIDYARKYVEQLFQEIYRELEQLNLPENEYKQGLIKFVKKLEGRRK